MELSDIKAEIEQGLLSKGLSAAAASRLACGNPSLIKNILNGHIPKVDSLIKLAKVLDLNFQLGQTICDNPLGAALRDSPKPGDAFRGKMDTNDLPRDAGGSATATPALPLELLAALGLPKGSDIEAVLKEVAGLRVLNPGTKLHEVAAMLDTLATKAREQAAPALTDTSALAASDTDLPGARPIDVIELACAAGGGADVLSEEVAGQVWFRRDWLDGQGLDATQCAVIGVSGESMEPTLVAGAKILINRLRRDWRKDMIYVVRTGDGLVVKRAGQDEDGRQILISDHPAWDDVPLPDNADVIGQVVWTARTLRGG